MFGSLGAHVISSPGTAANVPIADGIAPDIFMDFVNGVYVGATPASLTTTRNNIGWGDNAAGVWSQFAVNTPIITNRGLQIGGAVVGRALWARDMTQAAWVKTGITAVLNQTGIDGSANAASQLTATAANATAYQTVTLGSVTVIYSPFIKRISGSGPINLTVDGGTTPIPVTPTTSWQRFPISQAAVANPVFGIQIVSSGDVIAVDFNMLQQASAGNSSATSPILTTTAAVTYNADAISLALTPGTAVTLLANGFFRGGQVGSLVVIALTDGTAANKLTLFRQISNPRSQFVIASASTVILAPGTWTDNTLGSLAGAFVSGAGTACFNAGAVASATPTGFPAGLNQLTITGTNWITIAQFAIWLNHAASNAALQAIT